MQSNSEIKNQPETKPKGYSYEQWLKASTERFKTGINKSTQHFDNKDHRIAAETNKSIYEILISLKKAWILKSLKVKDLTNILMKDIMIINPLKASSFVLVEKIKYCLEDLKKIDTNLIKIANDDSKWFYELIIEYKVQQLIEPVIKQLDERIKIHLEKTQMLIEESTSRVSMHI